jgi:DNA-binding winged helix-turn-helix (wHTH) protein
MGCLQFGPFELDIENEELRKHGIRIRIQNQPFQVLRTLVERAGQVVGREELRQAVWANDTFVDFEHGLNAAMNKLRRTLGDSAEGSRYIETLAGRGYRFVGAVKNHQTPLPAPADGFLQQTLEPLPQRRSHPASKAWIALAAVGTAFSIWGLATLLTHGRGESIRPVVQFVISPPPGAVFAPPISRQAFAISPDGTRLAFTATDASGTNVWVRDLASLDMHPVPGTEGAWAIFWSPDSHSIFYSVKRILKQANLDTGSTRSVVNLPLLASLGAWRSAGDLLLYMGPTIQYELLVDNGALRKSPGETLLLPQFLPHSDRVLHVAADQALGQFRARVTDYVSRKSKSFMETDSRVQYAPPPRRGEPGALLYVRRGSLLVQPFDADRLRLAGEPFPIARNVVYFGPGAEACFSVSDNGVLAYQTGWPLSELKWYDRAGNVVGTVGRSAPYAGNLRISPDGREVAATVWNPDSGGSDIWIFDESGRGSRRFTYPPANHFRPVWSAKGDRVAFTASRIDVPQVVSLGTAEGSKERPFMNEASRAGYAVEPDPIAYGLVQGWPFHRVRHRYGGRRARDVADGYGRRRCYTPFAWRVRTMGNGLLTGWWTDRVRFHAIGPAGSLRPGIRLSGIAEACWRQAAGIERWGLDRAVASGWPRAVLRRRR